MRFRDQRKGRQNPDFHAPVVLSKEDGRGPDHPDFKNAPAFDLNGPGKVYDPREEEVGQRFRLEFQRHAQKPKLWRLRLHHVAADGSESVKATEWAEFHDFSPDMLLAQGQLKRFIFGEVTPMAQAQRRT